MNVFTRLTVFVCCMIITTMLLYPPWVQSVFVLNYWEAQGPALESGITKGSDEYRDWLTKRSLEFELRQSVYDSSRSNMPGDGQRIVLETPYIKQLDRRYAPIWSMPPYVNDMKPVSELPIDWRIDWNRLFAQVLGVVSISCGILFLTIRR